MRPCPLLPLSPLLSHHLLLMVLVRMVLPSDVLVRLVTPCTLTPMYLLVVGDTIKTACRNHKSAINFTQVHVDKVGSDNLWDRRLWWAHVKVAPCDLFFLDRTMRFLDRTMKFLDRTMRFLDRLRATCFFRSYNEVFRSQGSDSYTHFGWVSHVICHTTLSAHCPSSARCTLQYPYVLGTSLNKTTRCKIPAPSPPL